MNELYDSTNIMMCPHITKSLADYNYEKTTTYMIFGIIDIKFNLWQIYYIKAKRLKLLYSLSHLINNKK